MSRTEVSRSVRSHRPMDLSFSAKRPMAAALTLIPSSSSAAAASTVVRSPSSDRITATSAGLKRKYLRVEGSLTM